jgi:radical SAM protein with 4Fe4S-binding SPASM domain
VNDGNGFLFISHRGDLFPSGFLPIAAGNVRIDDPVTVYRDHELFRALRNPDLLKGKCGVCEYRSVCGGSRARAWALTGDALEADPSCAHVPAKYSRMVERGEAQDVDVYFRQRIPGWGARSRVGELPTIGSGNSRLPALCPR